MKNLSEYIINRFSVAGTKSDKILLFDIDDTLIKSDIRVIVKDRNGNIVKRLTSTEYNSYRLKLGEEFDYSEFDDESVLNNRSIFLKYWQTMKREYRKGTHIGILSARKKQDMFYRFFAKNGIQIKRELIFTINDESLNIEGNTIEERKTFVIKKLYNLGYKTFVFFDDNETNLKHAKELENQIDIKIYTVKA